MASRLPDELWERIGKRLNTKIDVSRFCAVCKSWRSFLPLFAKPLPFQFPIQVSFGLSLTLTESVVYHLAPPAGDPRERGWLISVKEGESGETHDTLHPISQSTVEQLPYSFPKLLNLLEYRVFEVAKVYGLSSNGRFCGKAALSLNLDFPAVMIVIGGILLYGKLGFDNKKFKVSPLLHEHWNKIYQDVIFYQGKFCAVCQNGTAIEVDSSLDVTMIASPIKRRFGLKCLVESSGELLLVHRPWDTKRPFPPRFSEAVHRAYDEDSYSSSGSSVGYADEPLKGSKFKVYKLNSAEKEWVEVEAEALCDRILVLGIERSYSVSSGDFPGCRGGSIYFYDPDTRALGRGSVFCLDSSFENIFCPPQTWTWLPSQQRKRLPQQDLDLDMKLEAKAKKRKQTEKTKGH